MGAAGRALAKIIERLHQYLFGAGPRDSSRDFVEVFTWVGGSIPAHAPESVKAIWKREESLCEKRDGHYGIEPAEVELLVPRRQ